MIKKSIIVLHILLFSFYSYCQDDQVILDSEFSKAEFNVALNPVDTNNIVVASMRVVNEGESDIIIYYTRDFGETWGESEFHGTDSLSFFSGDPVLSYDASGNLFLVYLIVIEDYEEGFEIKTRVAESQDGGENWNVVFKYGEFTDKPWFDIDISEESPYQGNKYIPIVEENVHLLTVSKDNELINSAEITQADQLPCVALSNDGDIYTTTLILDDPNVLQFHHFTQQGEELITRTVIAEFPDYTFDGEDVSTRFQPSAYMDVDNSDGPHAGRIYVAYTGSEASGEALFDVFLSFSDDRGLTWSTPKPVHENTEEGVQQFYSSLFVNDEGVLIMDWYDRADYGVNQGNTDFFMGISNDGGVNFDQLKLTSEPMDFFFTSQAGFEFGIGEYHQCVATDKTAVSFWSDGRENGDELNIYFAKVSLDEVLDVNEFTKINTDISIGLPYPNPAGTYTELEIRLEKSQDLKYTLTSNVGIVIKESEWKKYNPGMHRLKIDCDDYPSGQYLLTIKSQKGYFKTSQVIIK